MDHPPPYPSHHEGFTLIELSIVLIIIGLIVGGVLVGRDMIRAAELRSLVTDAERFKTAMMVFQAKYNCIPGDCANATMLFGTDSSGCPSGGGATGTCSGNGNEQVEWMDESLRFWQQLAQAGLIAGTYSGVSAISAAQLGVNVPSSRVAGVGFTAVYAEYSGSTDPAWRLPDTTVKNRLVIGKENHGWGQTLGAFATPIEAMMLDGKYDDGKPASGMITAMPAGYDINNNVLGSCAGIAATAADPTTRYLTTVNEKYCSLVFDLEIY